MSSSCSTPWIDAQPLNWSREGYRKLVQSIKATTATDTLPTSKDDTIIPTGFDILLNCDCIFEPLYGKSWELLVEVIDECLKLNPKCIVLTSVERRSGDGVDLFVNKLRDAYYCTFVSSVELISVDEGRNLELYLARGFI